jgi:hypothetical protein
VYAWQREREKERERKRERERERERSVEEKRRNEVKITWVKRFFKYFFAQCLYFSFSTQKHKNNVYLVN